MYRYPRGAFRSLIPVLIVLLLLGLAALPVADKLTERAVLREYDLRALLIRDSLDDVMNDWVARSRELAPDVGAQGSGTEARSTESRTSAARQAARKAMNAAFDRTVNQERVYALQLCDPSAQVIFKSARMPRSVECPKLGTVADQPGNRLDVPDRGPLHVMALRVGEGQATSGFLQVVQDLAVLPSRLEQSRVIVVATVFALALLIGAISLLVARLSWRDWVDSTRTMLAEFGANGRRAEGAAEGSGSASGTGGNGSSRVPPPELRPLAREFQRMLREVESEQRSSSSVADGTEWSAATLRDLLKRNFPGDEVIVLSNREPYIHQKSEDGTLKVNRPASGLVTAVEPVMRACSGTWIAHGAGNADRETVDANDRVAVPPDHPSYTLRRIWLSEAEEQGYYYGFANEGLWPLCHVAHVRPVFRSSDWDAYCAINQRFAEAVKAEAKTSDPIVLIQDYHFAMAPAMIRKLLPDATIIMFWHIPWPNFESFGICPWKEDILEGMLGSDILGFHTPYHCKNFIETVDRFLEARIEHESDTIRIGGSLTQVNAYPISIAWPEPLDPSKFPELRKAVRAQYGFAEDHRLAIGVDRLDYTKGMVERFRSVERLLELHPEWIGKFTLLQIAAPSRSSLQEYQRFDNDVRAQAEQINARYRRVLERTADGTQGRTPDGSESVYEPIKLLIEHHDSASVQKHYRAADLCVVTSLHDGMNLVSKEFIAAHDDERGVLILSRFAGAAGELLDALIVNPYHVDEVAESMHEGLLMDEHEQQVRMRSLRRMVRDFNVFRWAGRLLIDAGKLRRRMQLEARLRGGSRGTGSRAGHSPVLDGPRGSPPGATAHPARESMHG